MQLMALKHEGEWNESMGATLRKLLVPTGACTGQWTTLNYKPSTSL